jgi:deoxycytidylate deaminase
MKHDFFIESAIDIATRSDMRQKHGAVIVHRNKIIARGYNQKDNFCEKTSLHAEVAAILDMKKGRDYPRNFVTMYVIRIGTENGGTKHSRPCVNCEKSIIKSGIKRVYFSSNDP